MLGLVKDAFPYRIPGPNFGNYNSLVMVAPCNMACPYCDVGGYAKDRNHNLPGWRDMPLSRIEEFVDEEVDRGRIIYLTGGEPLMFPELVTHLGDRISARGGYSVVATNASLGARLARVSPHVNEFSISLKGAAETAEKISGLRGKTAFDAPRANCLGLLGGPNLLEFVVVLFDSLDLESVIKIYEPFFGRAFITFKQYRPKVTTTFDDHSYDSRPLIDLVDSQVLPMPLDEARALFDELCRRYSQHADRFALVAGGGGDQTVVRGTDEYLFERQGATR